MPCFDARRSIRLFLTLVCFLVSLSGCAGFLGHDSLRVNVAGLEPLESQGMEMRLNVKLRIQNPSDSPVEYNGVSLELELNGRPFASGVSDQSGVVPRFGETVIAVPVTVPALAAVRQAFAFVEGTQSGSFQYVLRGKLAGGAIGGTQFVSEGTLSLPSNLTGQ